MIPRIIIRGMYFIKIKGNHTAAVLRSPKPCTGVRIPLPLLKEKALKH